MPETLEDLLSRVREAKMPSGEAATKQGLLLPILARLGWNTDDPHEVFPELKVRGGSVDYCLRDGDKSAVFIEAKAAGEKLDRHQEQLLGYAFREGVELAVLTNGLSWWLYLPLTKNRSWEQRRFSTIDILLDVVPAAASQFRRFLHHDRVADGSAVEDAKSEYERREENAKIETLVAQTIPVAWKQLCLKKTGCSLTCLRRR